MDTNLPKTDGANSARRRLIKGGFAVPAALTVASGSALARTSSTCLARDAAAGQTPPFDSANATWLRVLAYYSGNRGGPNRSFWVTYSDLLTVATLAGVSIKNNWITSGQALCVRAGGNFIAGQIYSSATSPVLPSLTPSTNLTNNTRYHALLVDANGDIIGISDVFTASGQSGGAVHQSCWNSFALSK